MISRRDSKHRGKSESPVDVDIQAKANMTNTSMQNLRWFPAQ